MGYCLVECGGGAEGGGVAVFVVGDGVDFGGGGVGDDSGGAGGLGGFAHGVGVDGEGLGVVAGGEGGESADDGAGGDDGECLFEGVAGAFDAGELVGGEHAVGQEDDFGGAAGTGGCGDVEDDVVAGVDGECSGGLVEVGDESGGGECEDDAVAGGGGFGEGFDVEVGDFSEVVGGFDDGSGLVGVDVDAGGVGADGTRGRVVSVGTVGLALVVVWGFCWLWVVVVGGVSMVGGWWFQRRASWVGWPKGLRGLGGVFPCCGCSVGLDLVLVGAVMRVAPRSWVNMSTLPGAAVPTTLIESAFGFGGWKLGLVLVSMVPPLTSSSMVSRRRTRPWAPASTTPASRRTASWEGVLARAMAAAVVAAVSTSISESVGAWFAAMAAARRTVTTVPSTGSIMAW